MDNSRLMIENDLFKQLFFLEPPDSSVSLEEFEDFAVKRLKLLRILEKVTFMSTTKVTKKWREFEDEVSEAGLAEFLYLTKAGDDDEYHRAQKFDRISHYILRLAFCRTEKLRRWFVNQEVKFFRYKFNCYADGNLAKKILDTHFQGIVTQVKDPALTSVKEELNDTYYYVSDVLAGGVYEVPFTQCLNLVKTRRVFLKNGKAYFCHPHFQTIVNSEFSRLLSEDLTVLNKRIHIVDNDERVAKVLNNFDKRHTGSSYKGEGGTVKKVATHNYNEATVKGGVIRLNQYYKESLKTKAIRDVARKATKHTTNKIKFCPKKKVKKQEEPSATVTSCMNWEPDEDGADDDLLRALDTFEEAFSEH